MLLPEAIDDYVGSDNPVRLIEAFVDSIDLVAAGFLPIPRDVAPLFRNDAAPSFREIVAP